MPKSAHSLEGATVEDHAAMKKQWQTNLEIDLLKSAWIRKDREQHGAHTAPPLSAAKEREKTTAAATVAPPNEGNAFREGSEVTDASCQYQQPQQVRPRPLSVGPHSDHPSIVDY
ncbi:hypothetical protein PC129_g7168 [Phytophthora cactorum]|uniref:Uncharacterized protein n=1 Tax=Phytophthora cactorum TaxID=29920 RepID=A0A8T1ICB5_9STRA|nr:hypothetical protein PC129_g7168 [Phytophthora cactorum]